MNRASYLLFALTLIPGAAAPASAQQIAPEYQAGGAPIFDCTGAQAAIDKLSKGLPQQEEWIRKSEEQLKQSEEGLKDTQKEMKKAALDAVQDFLKSQIKSSKMLRARIEAMKPLLPNGQVNPNGMTDLARRAWLDKLDNIDRVGDAIKSGGAGFDYGKALRENTADWNKLSTMLSESGVGKEAVGMGMKFFLGPEVGEMATQAIFVTGQAAYLGASAYIDARDAAKFKENLDKLKAAHDNILSDIDSYKEIVNGPCTQQAQQKQEQPKPEQTAKQVDPPKPPPPAQKPAKSGGGGAGVAKALIITGAAVAGGVVAAGAVSNATAADSTGSGGDSSVSIRFVSGAFNCTFNSGGVVNSCTGSSVVVNITGSIPVGTSVKLLTNHIQSLGTTPITSNPPGNMTFSGFSPGGWFDQCGPPVTELDLLNVSTNNVIASQRGLSIGVSCK